MRLRCFYQLLVFMMLVLLGLPAWGAQLNQVQSGTLSVSSSGTHTVNVTSVDTSKSFLIFQTRHSSNRPGGSMAAGRIASSTTLEFKTVRSDTIDIQWYVVEFASGVKVQRGTTAHNSTTENSSITPVASLGQAFLTWSKVPGSSDSIWSEDDPVVGELTSTSNVQFRSVNASGMFSNGAHEIWWQVIEYTNAADITVQRGTTSIASRSDSQTVSISTVDLSKSILLAGFRIGAQGSQINRRTISAEFSATDEIEFKRHRQGGNETLTEIGWQVIQFNDGTVVQSGVDKVNNNASSKNVSITTIDTSRAIALGSVQPVGGQNMGRTKYSSDDIPGVASFTLGLTANSLSLQRNYDGHEATLGWFVVEFPGLPDPVAEWRMDETSWGVVSDSSSNNLNGTSFNGAYTAGTSPAIAGTPGTCRYGEFDGSNDFVRVADNSLLDISTELTVTAWINPDQIPASGLKSILSKDENYEFHIDSSGQIYWWWHNTSNQEKTLTTTGASLTAGTWYHIAIVYRSGSQKIYIDGVERASSSEVGNLLLNSDPLEIGADQGHSGRYFDGSIDEARVYDVALSQAQVQVVKDITRPCAAALPTPIVEWRFDEDQWTGAANEVKDNGSGGYHGRSVNSADTASSTPAITGDPGTCGYGSFTSSRHGSVRVDGLPIPTSSGSQVTVTFWMYWKGGRWSMPFGFGTYDLFFNNGNHFGFNTWRWDTYGVRSNGLANGWHHVAAVFTDSDVYNNRLIIDGVEQSLSRRGSARNSNAQLSSSVAISGYTGGSSYWFDGYLDEVRIYSGALQVSQVQAIMAETHPCSSSVEPFAFNCVESGGDALSGKLYTKMVGQNFSVDVVALEDADTDGTADGVETDYASDADRTVAFELIDTSTAAACAAYPAVSPAIAQNIVFTSSDSGRKTSASMSVTKAYRSLGCRVTDSSGASPIVGCSTDMFSVRPTALSLGIPSLTNSGSSGAPTATAGSNFSLTADADAGYDGTPKIDSSKLAAHTGAIQTGTLTGSFGGADPSTGTALGNSFSYSEVGNFRFLAEGVYDDTFTAVDQSSDCTNDFSNTVSAGKVGCKFGNTATTGWVGRFIPADFVVSIDSNGALQNSCVAGGYSYAGEGIGFDPANLPSATITARNSSGATTQNYTGSYSKLSLASINMPSISTDGTQVGVDGSNRIGLAWATGIPVFTDNSDGTFTFGLSGDTFTYAKTQNDLIAPFTADVDLTIQSIVDDDSVAGTGLPQQFSPTGVPVRFGRMVLDNTQGSELNPLNMPMRTEYYNGAANGFILNSNDSCSQVTELRLLNQTGSVVISGAGRNTAIYAPASISTVYAAADLSNLGLLFTQPPTTTPGLFNLNLQATGAGNTGSMEVEALVPDALKYWWTGTTATEDPKAKATFGIYSRPTSIIYQRESR